MRTTQCAAEDAYLARKGSQHVQQHHHGVRHMPLCHGEPYRAGVLSSSSLTSVQQGVMQLIGVAG
jgi:hypothetical protein